MNVGGVNFKTSDMLKFNKFFTYAYRDFVANNDYAIFIQIPGLFKRQRLKNVFRTLHVLRNRWVINSFKTDKKTFAAEYW